MTAVSFPITWAATWSTTSGITGLTFPGMIDEPFCSSGSRSSTSPVRGPEPISTRSWAIFVRDTATPFSAPCNSTRPSRLPWASKASRGADAESQPLTHLLRELRVGVQPGPGRGPAQRNLDGTLERVLDAVVSELYLRRVAPELLAERHGHGIHHVGATGLDELGELVGLARERGGQLSRAGRSSSARWRPPPGAPPTETRRSTTAPCSRGRSGARPRRRGSRSPRWRSCSRRCRSRSGRRRWELVVVLAGGDLVARRRDPLRDVAVEQPELGVHPRRLGLDPAEPAHDRRRNAPARYGKFSTAFVVSDPQSSCCTAILKRTCADPAQGSGHEPVH